MLKVCAPFPHLHHQHSIFSTPIFPSVPLPFRPRVRLGRPRAQRLQLYESNATPKLYACFEKYSKPGNDPVASILAPIGSSFDVAFDHFKKFFKLKTGKHWEERLQKTVPRKDAFMFAPPKEVEPRGVLQNDGLLIKDEGGSEFMDLTREESHGAKMNLTSSLKSESGDAIMDVTGEEPKGSRLSDGIFMNGGSGDAFMNFMDDFAGP